MNERCVFDNNHWILFAKRAVALFLLISMSAGQALVASAASHKRSPSSLLTTEERLAVEQSQWLARVPEECHDAGDIAAQRECYDRRFFAPLVRKQNAKYKVQIQPSTISGVNVEFFTPAEGVSPSNLRRILINLHGGGFMYGARLAGQVGSIPIASVGRIKVVSVDYRMAPEHAFPAASEDVAAVYRALLNKYKPRNIGIYGCSAGAVLTAEAVAWIQSEKLPRPGAVGMFCGAASFWSEGDSGAIARADMSDPTQRTALEKFRPFILPEYHPYFRAANLRDPLVFPIYSNETLARFPSSLLLSSTRDIALSSVVHTHSRLNKLGIKSELYVWEGVDHDFFSDPDIPQSQEVYERVAKFFNENLGKT